MLVPAALTLAYILAFPPTQCELDAFAREATIGELLAGPRGRKIDYDPKWNPKTLEQIEKALKDLNKIPRKLRTPQQKRDIDDLKRIKKNARPKKAERNTQKSTKRR